MLGIGTQRVQEEIGRMFPGVACQRMDADTMRSGRDYEQSLAGFRRGEVKVLLGTQMIAKGLDFPNVRLVGVISADTALHLPDFRSAERTFQLVAQVAGRAGRGQEGGLVIVQTFNPDEPAIVMAGRHDYEGFAGRELEVRRAAGYPPVTRMARIVLRDRDDEKGRARAKELAAELSARNGELGLGVQIAGPMPCAMARLAEYYRQEIQLVAGDAGRLQRLLLAVRKAGLLRSDLLTAVDVDPVALM
jgi:primosomal protein N' (replication factor Y)